jgi:uncharacterized protein
MSKHSHDRGGSPVETPIPISREPARWSRVSLLELGEVALLMDRDNGKWVSIPARLVPVARLLPAPGYSLPEPVRSARNELARELEAAGLTRGLTRSNEKLTTLIVKLTNACNYACTYCYDREKEDQATNLSFEAAAAAVRQALELVDERLTVVLHGGEPTLRFTLIRQVVLDGETAAADLGKSVSFCGQTNLSRLTQEMVDFSRQHSISWGLSLDGPPDLNNRFRVNHSGAGTHDHFLKALEQFPDFVRDCGVMTTITSATDEHLLTIARYFRDQGVASWDWSLFQPIGRGRLTAHTIEFSPDTLIDSWNELFDAVVGGEFDGFPIMPVLKYVDNFLDGPGNNMCMRKECGAGRDLLSLSADKTIEACDCIDPAGDLSSLGKFDPAVPHALKAAKDGDKARLIRSRDVSAGRCDTCIWLSVCGGTCLAHAGELHGVWEAQCELALNAFGRVAESVTRSNALRRYRESCRRSG